jgi:hypothetical protein
MYSVILSFGLDKFLDRFRKQVRSEQPSCGWTRHPAKELQGSMTFDFLRRQNKLNSSRFRTRMVKCFQTAWGISHWKMSRDQIAVSHRRVNWSVNSCSSTPRHVSARGRRDVRSHSTSRFRTWKVKWFQTAWGISHWKMSTSNCCQSGASKKSN